MTTGGGTMRVAILDDFPNASLSLGEWDRLRDIATVEVFTDHLADEDAVHARLESFDCIVAMRERTRFPRSLLDRLPRLRLLVTTGTVNAAIDVAAAADNGVVVSSTDSSGTSTIELTWALTLAVTRGIPREDAAIRAGGWQVGVGPELRGRTLGLLGVGRIGAGVAAIGTAFGMKLIAWTPNLTDERAAALGAMRVDKDELFAQADVVSVHAPLSERSRGLVGARELALMKSSAFLVNTARGPIVDEAALIDALESGSIAGAALDVFDEEPLAPEHPFRHLPNTVVTPHLGYVATDIYRMFFDQAIEDILAFHAGSPIRVVSP